MTRQIERWFLPVEGLVSGVVTSLVSIYLGRQLPPAMISIILFFGMVCCLGGVFGVVIAAHVHLFREVDSLHRLVGFVVTCMVAYPANIMFARAASSVLPGLVGSAIVCAGVLLFLVSPGSLTSRQLTTFLPKALGGSVVCGILGAFGWAVGKHVPIPESLLASHDNLAYPALTVMVQMGAASLVGFLMPQEAMPGVPQPVAPPGPAEPKAGQGAQFVAAVTLLVLAYGVVLGFTSIQQYVEDAPFRHQREAQRKFASEHPSLTHLPPIVAPPVGQVLLLRDISGHTPGHHSVSFGGKRPGAVESVSYTVEYEQLGASPSAYRYRPCGVGCFYENEAPFADVSVVIYPTPAWAVYSTKQLARMWLGAPAFDPNSVKAVSIGGNRVIRDAWLRHVSPGGEPLSFFWASGSRVVRVTFLASEDDEFLKEYLIWYPSTL